MNPPSRTLALAVGAATCISTAACRSDGSNEVPQTQEIAIDAETLAGWNPQVDDVAYKVPQNDSERPGTEAFRRRTQIENLSIDSQLLLAVPTKQIEPVLQRDDGLLQREVALEVVEYFVGGPPAPAVRDKGVVIRVDEIVWHEKDFIGQVPKEHVVSVERCHEADGTPRLVVFEAHVAAAKEMLELREDSKRFAPKQEATRTRCEFATTSALTKYMNDKETYSERPMN